MVREKSFIVFLLFLAFLGCKAKPPPEILRAPPVKEEKRLPVDYVFLLDNSGSIPRGEARSFGREAVKAFVDLAEPEDRISFILFDTDARIIASETIKDEAIRTRLKEAIERGLTFEGIHSDISAGVGLLKDRMATLFRGAGKGRPVAILISDGKLEPRGHLQTAYQRLLDHWKSLSDLVPFYCLGLGDREINEPFLSGVTGRGLFTQMSEGSGGQFYRIGSVDQLVAGCINVLRNTKGFGELPEQEVYWTDESAQRLSFLVIKRLPDRELCKTQQIRVRERGGREIGFSESQTYAEGKTRILWHQGPYYDLITVGSPSQGKWEVSLESGEKPKIVALIRNQIHLRYQVPREYWDQERKVVLAWLYDERTGALSERPCQLTLRFDSFEAFQTSPHKILLQKTKEATYAANLKLEGKEPSVGNYSLQIRAEDERSFFFRRGPTIPVRIKEAYFRFNLPEGIAPKWPFFWKGLRFALELNGGHQAYPQFQDPPEASLYLEKVEEGKRIVLRTAELTPEKADQNLSYHLWKKDLKSGQYAAHIVMEGRLTTGKEVRVESPEFYFELRWPFWVWIGLGLIALFIATGLAWLFRPRLRGRLNFEKPFGKEPIHLAGHKKTRKSIKGDSLSFGIGGDELTELEETSFTLAAIRRSGLKIILRRGDLTLTRDGQEMPIRQGPVYRGDLMSFHDHKADYMIEVVSRRRPPRRRRRCSLIAESIW